MFDKKHLGTLTELEACAFLLKQGYDVFRNVSPHGLSDLIAVKYETNEVIFLDVKSSPLSAPKHSQLQFGVKLMHKHNEEWLFADMSEDEDARLKSIKKEHLRQLNVMKRARMKK